MLEGTGGIKSLGEDDKAGIAQTINEEILKGTPISFRSTAVRPDGDGRLHVTGDLELANGINLIAFDLDHHRRRPADREARPSSRPSGA